jgi:hypothetical protein
LVPIYLFFFSFPLFLSIRLSHCVMLTLPILTASSALLPSCWVGCDLYTRHRCCHRRGVQSEILDIQQTHTMFTTNYEVRCPGLIFTPSVHKVYTYKEGPIHTSSKYFIYRTSKWISTKCYYWLLL